MLRTAFIFIIITNITIQHSHMRQWKCQEKISSLSNDYTSNLYTSNIKIIKTLINNFINKRKLLFIKEFKQKQSISKKPRSK